MLKLSTLALMPEMKLAKAIYDHEGKLLIEDGIALRKTYIEKFKKYNIDYVYIKWEKEYNKEITNLIAEETRLKTLNLVKDSLEKFISTKKIDTSQIKLVINEIIQDLLKNRGILFNLTDIRVIDDYTFGHSVNVCLLSLIIGIALDYNKGELQTLGIGALLHDIGKIHINNRIVNKPGILTRDEYEIMKNHAIIGYEIIKDIGGLAEGVAWIARDHHERYDGKGYPGGLKGNSIDVFSRIVAICDVYDALTSHRVYRKGISPHEAIEYLISMGNHQFDHNLVKVFLKHIFIYPEGTIVKLQSGNQAIVVKNNGTWPTRPVVEIIYDDHEKNGRKNRIDLMTQLNNSIIGKIEA